MKNLRPFGTAALMSLLAACDDRGYDGYMGGWGHMMPYGYGGIFMWIIFLIILAVIIYALARGYSSGKFGPSGETPLDILKKRYAKGEITKDQFEQMKKDLRM